MQQLCPLTSSGWPSASCSRAAESSREVTIPRYALRPGSMRGSREDHAVGEYAQAGHSGQRRPAGWIDGRVSLTDERG